MLRSKNTDFKNDSSDIRLSTLMKIVQDGLGGKLKLTLEL